MQLLAEDRVLESTWIVVIGSDDAARTTCFVPGSTGRHVTAAAVAVFHVLALLTGPLVSVTYVLVAVSPFAIKNRYMLRTSARHPSSDAIVEEPRVAGAES